jgi:hypothetical protein
MATYNSTAAATSMFVAGTLSNFTVHLSVAVTKARTFVVSKNGTNTAITCTIAAAATTCTDSTHTAAFAASDTILVTASYSGSNNATNPTWSGTYP